MTPKEKAKAIVDKYTNRVLKINCSCEYSNSNRENWFKHIKQCSIIAIDEIIDNINPESWGLEMDKAFEDIQYWQEVKQEINNL